MHDQKNVIPDGYLIDTDLTLFFLLALHKHFVTRKLTESRGILSFDINRTPQTVVILKLRYLR